MITNTDSVAVKQCNNTNQYLPNGNFQGLSHSVCQNNRDEAPGLNKSGLFVSLRTKSYVPVTGCVFEHIISTPDLSYPEKLFFLLSNSLAIINFSKTGQRSAALPANLWANMLGCSRSMIFALQKSLATKGYFNIIRNKNFYDQNKRNLITPALPTHVAVALGSYPDRVGAAEQQVQSMPTESLLLLDRTKLFIPLNYQLLKFVCQDQDLSPLQKIIWLDLYTYSFKASNNNNRKEKEFFVTNSYQKLAQRYGCNISTLSRAMTALQKQAFITRDRFLLKHSAPMEERKDKVLWRFSVSLPPERKDLFDKIADRSNIILSSDQLNDNNQPKQTSDPENNSSLNKTDQNLDKSIFAKNAGDDAQIASDDPDIANSSRYINKNLKTKNNNNRNIKSNFRDTAKVILNNFRKKLEKKTKPFNICTELIRQKLRTLSKEKADKARKFAYSLHSKKLAKGYASTISKHELAKQLIFHAATWIPDKLGKLSRDQQIDTALAVAWKYIISGNWQQPLEWEKAKIMQHEYECYYQKYYQQGTLSAELRILERETRSLLDSYVSLEREIKSGAGTNGKDGEGNSLVLLGTDMEDKGSEERYQYVDGHQLMPEFKEEFEYEERKPSQYQYDISEFSIDERQLKLTTSETSNMVSIETSAHLVHYFELKLLEANSDDEVVMTLKRTGMNKFLNLAESDIKSDNKKEIPDLSNRQVSEGKFQTKLLTAEEENTKIDKLLMTEHHKCAVS